MKKYSIAIPLSDHVYNLAKECQQRIYDSTSIESARIHVAEPHINLISGTSNNINDVICSINKFHFNNCKFCELLGIGVLITPNPLIYMRFTNSVFLRELRFYLFNKTLPLWDEINNSVQDDIWIPKSTLAFKDLTLNDLSKALISLKDLKFNFRMEISEISVIDFTENEHEVTRIII